MASKPVQHVPSLVDVPKAEPLLTAVPIGKHFTLSASGLTITGEPTFEICAGLGDMLRTFEVSIQFAIGDWVNYMEARFSEQASQAIDAATGWTPSTVRVYAWTAQQVPPANRMIDRGLSFRHHMLVAALPAPAQRKWLEAALKEKEPWTVNRLAAALKDGVDRPINSHDIYVTCTSEKQRTRLTKMIELEGAVCRAIDRRAQRVKS